jgi:secreted trypsin-like serine protease
MANHKEGPNNNKPQSRIIDGVNSEKNEFPWHVGIVYEYGPEKHKRIFCGGSIVSSKTIVYAAHCRLDVLWGVVVGEHGQFITDGEQYFKMCADYKHPKYRQGKQRLNYDPYFYDYAVLILCKPLTWSRSVLPICLPSVSGTGTQYENKEVISTGYGGTNGSDPHSIYKNPPAILKKVKMTTMSNVECRSSKYVYKPYEIDKTGLCAISPNKGVCYGDSGGPLVMQVM